MDEVALTTSRKRRHFALFGLAALTAAAVIFVGVLTESDNGGAASTTGAPASARPNTGPLTGSFAVTMGQKLLIDGTPSTSEDAAPSLTTWRLSSVCRTSGCVATASGGGLEGFQNPVFDDVGGRWLFAGTSRGKCKERDDDELWYVISIQPHTDGTLSGEAVTRSANECSDTRTVVLTRTADTNVSLLPDPAAVPARVVSPAEAVHGHYDIAYTYASGASFVRNFGVRTDCLRTGDRCMSFFISSEQDIVAGAFVYSNGAWIRNSEFKQSCVNNGKQLMNFTETVALPQTRNGPIQTLTGHGYSEVKSGRGGCRSQKCRRDFHPNPRLAVRALGCRDDDHRRFLGVH